MFGGDGLPLVVGRRQAFHLGQLPGEPLAFGVELALAFARAGQGRGGLGPSRVRGGHRRGVDAGLLVEQRAHGGRAGEALPGVLAVDVDEVVGHLAQLGERGGAAVDERAALALGVDHAAQQQRLVDGEAGLVEPARERRGRVEFGRDLAARAAFAHHAAFGARAEGQLQRVDEDGLAGARLAGEHYEPGAELEFERIDDDEVFQRQATQHGQDSGEALSDDVHAKAARRETRRMPAAGLMW